MASNIVEAKTHWKHMYEIHLTIAPVSAALWPAFEQYAASIDAKAMAIELARGEYPLQPMLTLARGGELDDVIQFAHALMRKSAQSKYQVLRCKIEQDASVNALPGDAGSHHYFEWHGRIVVAEARRLQLAAVCQAFGGHLSNNAVRGGDSRYVTLREPDDFSMLSSQVAALSIALNEQGWKMDKQQWERVVYDSNLTLDSGWLELVQ
jgi:hypothetical protein